MGETKPKQNENKSDEEKNSGDSSDVEELEAALNEIEHALDNLESQNGNIHSKLQQLLESNREIRKEMADLITNEENGSERAAAKSSRTPRTARANDLPKDNKEQDQDHETSKRLSDLKLDNNENGSSSNSSSKASARPATKTSARNAKN